MPRNHPAAFRREACERMLARASSFIGADRYDSGPLAVQAFFGVVWNAA